MNQQSMLHPVFNSTPVKKRRHDDSELDAPLKKRVRLVVDDEEWDRCLKDAGLPDGYDEKLLSVRRKLDFGDESEAEETPENDIEEEERRAEERTSERKRMRLTS